MQTPRTVGLMDQAHRWAPRVVAVLAFALYALAAPPGYFWLDSAELSAASLGLGIAHPTGFPLYCVVVKLASLIPIGELAFRVNLLSAVSAALAVLWVGRLVSDVCRPPESEAAAPAVAELIAVVAAVGAALTLALSLTFFRQATVAEVYAPGAALLAATLLLFNRVAHGGGARDGLLLAVVAGLGLAMHTTYMLVGLPLVALFTVRLFRGARWPLAAPLLVVLVAGGTYLYLPVRAAAGVPAPLQWDDTSTSSGFVAHATGERIRRAYSEEMQSTVGARVASNAADFATDVIDQLLLALLAAGAGLLWLLRRRHRRWLGGTLLFLLSGDAVYSFWLNPMGIVDLQNGVPLALAVSVSAGCGLAWLGRALGRGGPFIAAAAAVVVVVPVAMVSWRPVWAASAGDLPRAWAQAALDETAPGGVVMVVNDSSAAGLIYMTTIEAARPDVAVLVRQHMVNAAERSRRILARSAPGRSCCELFGDRPITWELGHDRPPDRFTLVAAAPLARLVAALPGPAYRREDVEVAAHRIIALFDHASARDRSAATVFAHALNSLGIFAHQRRDIAAAIRAYDAALAVRPDYQRALVNRGAAAAASGDFPAAIAFTERALAVSPNHVIARVNAARYHMQLGNDARALRHIERARTIAPDNADTWAIVGILAARAGDLEAAREYLEHALDLDPANPDARRTMVRLMEESQ